MLTLLLAARRSPVPRWVGEMLRWARHFEMWSMLEVMMLGILVALIKIARLATVEPGSACTRVGALCPAVPGDRGHLRRARNLAAAGMVRRRNAAARARRSAAPRSRTDDARRRDRRAGSASCRARRASCCRGRRAWTSRATAAAAASTWRSAATARSRRPGRSSSPRRSATSRPCAAGADHYDARGRRRPTRS